MSYALTGLDDKVAVVSGAGRMRSIGRPIAVALARAGCDVVLTGTGRSKDRYPDARPMGYPFARPFPASGILTTLSQRPEIAMRRLTIRCAQT